jgi:putative salt-induced outer membrane protein YdiY/small nuclear ribonucleoprotein (snRNP)-like protein
LQIQRVVLSLALFLSLPLFARENIDIIIMRNGDRMTGQVKGLDDGVLSVSLPYVVQTLSVDWSKVARITSNQLFIVKTENGSVYRGTLNTAEEEGGKPVKIEIVETPAKQSAIEQAQIVQIAETSNKFWHQFNGAVNFGFTYTKGNETVQYTLASATEYLRERWSAEAKWSSAFSTSSGVTASKRNEITATCQHLLPWNNYFYAGLSDFLQSSVQGIQLQTSVGGGIGRYLKNTNRATISLLGGFAWQNTQYKRATFPAGTQNLAAALVLGEVKLFKFNKTNLAVTGQLFPVLSDPGRVKFNMNAAYYIKIIGNLSWNMSFYGNWDNQPPPHFQGSDYGTSSGLSWTFGMKRDVRTGLAGINF